MTSRLERLFVLLECGGGAATRRAAARQLGEVQRAHPHELQRLLARVAVYLRSSAWETRVAAGQAVEAILSNVPEWDPAPCLIKKEEKEAALNEVFDSGRLRFETFNMESVLKYGSHLMGSEGKEYDVEEDMSAVGDIKEKLARQRQLLNAKLGLDVASKLGMDLSDVYTNEDLACNKNNSQHNDNTKRHVSELVNQSLSNNGQSLCQKTLSSREQNRARRKARQTALVKQKSRDINDEPGTSNDADEPDKKKIKMEMYDDMIGESHPSSDGSWGVECAGWPLEAFAGALAADLFAAGWEARHGAATALRELLKRHGRGAAKERGMTKEEMEESNQAWLEDISLRLTCVLALDKFGDFISDQVVAPVRETCAQALGAALALMCPANVCAAATCLAGLLQRPHWEARHGALLGFKYLVAVREELACSTRAFDFLISGLCDPVEDVGAVAAAALVPAARALVCRTPSAVPDVVERLWQLLGEQDELAAACNSFMALLAALVSLPEARTLIKPIPLPMVLPRLWPYLSHATSSVRRAALQTLRTLTRPQPQNGQLTTQENSGDTVKVIVNGCKTPAPDQPLISHDTKEFKSEQVGNGNHTSKCPNGNETCNVRAKLEDVAIIEWTPELLQTALRHIFQRVLVEHVQDIQDNAEQVWMNLVRHARLECVLHAACPLMSMWMCLAMQPAKIPFEAALMLQPTPLRDRRPRPPSQSEGIPLELADIEGSYQPPQKWYIGGSETTPANVREQNVIRSRVIAARMLGFLSCYIVQPAPGIVYTPDIESPIDCYVKVLLVYVSSKSALQRLVVGLVISSWASLDSNLPGQASLQPLLERLHQCLLQTVFYDEVAVACNRALQDTRDLLAMMRHYKLPLDCEEWSAIVRLDQVIKLTDTLGQQLIASMKVKRISQQLEERRKNIHSAATQCSSEQNALNISVQAALAGACANLHGLPEKLNPLIKPLMESVKRETSKELQELAARHLAVVLAQCVDRQPSPNAKVLSNLKTFLRCDPEFTPKIYVPSVEEAAGSNIGDSGSGESSNENSRTSFYHSRHENFLGILTLTQQQCQAERATLRRTTSTAPVFTGAGTQPPPLPRGPGRPPTLRPPTDIPIEELLSVEDESQEQLRVQRRGATFAFTSLTKYFADDLPHRLPKLWDFVMDPLLQETNLNNMDNRQIPAVEELVSCLQVLEVIVEHLSPPLLPLVLQGMVALARLLRHAYKAVRHLAARCLAALANIAAPKVMQLMVDQVVGMLGSIEDDPQRQGAAEALACVVDKLQINIVPYIVLLVIPLLGRMSDHNEPVRLMSTRCFATLIQLMPLDGAISEPPGLPDRLRQQRDRDRVFLDQLFNPKNIKDYKVPVPISAELRCYQQAGINWLRFLNSYKLHGVLCDDMGLGKTLQSICVVAGDHYERAARYKVTRAPDAAPLPSLVVCPPTLTGHWVYEVRKFFTKKYLNPLQYAGPPTERERLRTHVGQYNLIVASYDIVRKDIDFFSSIKWNYCILDEGHIIKNGKTKAFKAIKMIVAHHRLILSGTPIQNNVLELWSLFDFLMPGFLGTERQFTTRYSRPILAARDPRATQQHQVAGALAMEALHRQILPFLLRRVKEDVLKELPPKITQDYYCELSPLQRRLYEDFSRTHMPAGLEAAHAHPQSHIFKALRYLQNVCNHPKLVLTPEHPEYETVSRELTTNSSNLNDIEHSAKLPALKQLLLDCGIGCSTLAGSSSDSSPAGVISQHRVLIFCQLKVMLDVVERDLLRAHMPAVTYLRLDGAVPPGARHQLVQRFNNDPSIDVLLLTTKVGGLGLNLTGADTVIFVEHDWNPMKDLQAMDRAHRIGQRKVVNVYRLITRNTLEEKIMGLQKFKLVTANTVISSENAAMETMGTDQLLDLFQLGDSDNNRLQRGTSHCDKRLQGGTSQSVNALIDSLPDLWDDKQYEEEYDMSNFIKGLKKT